MLQESDIVSPEVVKVFASRSIKKKNRKTQMECKRYHTNLLLERRRNCLALWKGRPDLRSRKNAFEAFALEPFQTSNAASLRTAGTLIIQRKPENYTKRHFFEWHFFLYNVNFIGCLFYQYMEKVGSCHKRHTSANTASANAASANAASANP